MFAKPFSLKTETGRLLAPQALLSWRRKPPGFIKNKAPTASAAGAFLLPYLSVSMASMTDCASRAVSFMWSYSAFMAACWACSGVRL